MNDAIRMGMYRGENTGIKPISLDPRMIKIKQEDGVVVEVPSMAYVRDLERQILELKKGIGIVESAAKHQDGVIKRVVSAVKKVDSKLR